MREIKFRAWDKDNKKMLKIYNISWFVGGGISHLTYEEDLVSECPECGKVEKKTRCIFGNFDLMQYTELKDKNGKEIYEGDIVVAMGCKTGKEVKYIGSGFYRVFAGMKVILDFTEDFEIIGNIYENRKEKTNERI